MDSIDITALQLRTRRKYERARLLSGVYTARWALPAIAFSLLTSNAQDSRLLLGGALLIAVIGLKWIGQAYGRAIVPSLLAGTAPLVLPLLLRGGGHACLGGVCWSVCMLGCIVGGLTAGAMIGWLAAREREQRFVFLGASLLLTVLTGSLGCAMVGAAGIVGMLVAVIATSLPVSWALQMRAG